MVKGFHPLTHRQGGIFPCRCVDIYFYKGSLYELCSAHVMIRNRRKGRRQEGRAEQTGSNMFQFINCLFRHSSWHEHSSYYELYVYFLGHDIAHIFMCILIHRAYFGAQLVMSYFTINFGSMYEQTGWDKISSLAEFFFTFQLSTDSSIGDLVPWSVPWSVGLN